MERAVGEWKNRVEESRHRASLSRCTLSHSLPQWEGWTQRDRGKALMKRRLRTLIVLPSAILMTLAMAMPASAHRTGPCNGDLTGRDYAQHHIVPFATGGDLGNDGHKPGTHQGYSICLGLP